MSKIVLILGSVRRDRKASIVANWVRKVLATRNHQVFVADPLQLNLPLLDRMYKEMENPPQILSDLHNTLVNADGFLPITPEYNHSVSGPMKNTLDYFLEEYFFKPSAIISYSVGGFGGNLAAAHLRQIFAELGAPSIPSTLSISKVHQVLDNNGNLLDNKYEQKIAKFLDEFEWYIEAFKNQRKKGTPY